MDEQVIINDKYKNIIAGIIKECYWDYNVDENYIINVVNSDDLRLKQKLFEKIIYNSKDRLKSLQIFKKSDLNNLFDSFTPKYNEKYINRHLMVLRNIFLNETNRIEGLEWKKR